MTIRIILLLASALLILSLPTVLLAAEWYVDASVSASGDGSSPEVAFKTIQEGIDKALDGDTVTVANGVYLENILFKGKNIILTSTDPLDPSVVASTIIDGNKLGSVVTLSGAESEACVICGFRIQNGKTMDDGGGFRGNESSASIRDNSITGNSADNGGGLSKCWGTIERNLISGNWATQGGGGLSGCNYTIQDNVIRGNWAYKGGGLHACNGIVQDNAVNGNWADEGGGFYFCQGTLQNNNIIGNWADEGGGLHSCGGTIRHNIIVENSAESSDGGGISYCDGTIESNVVGQNAARNGGGLYNCGGTLEGNAISGNAALIYGGGLYGCNGTIQNNTIFRNRASRVGGLYDCDGTILNNTISENWATDFGGAVHDCGGIIRNSIIWGNSSPDHAQVLASHLPSYCCIQDWSGGGEGNIAEVPKFVDAENGVFRLLPDSPCIDAGFNSPDLPEFDIAGMHRIMFGGRSLTVDMGACEFYINKLEPVPGTNEAVFTWSSLADKTYSIFYTDDLFNWQIAIDNFPSLGNQTTSWLDNGSLTGLPPLLAPKRFYRVLENP